MSTTVPSTRARLRRLLASATCLALLAAGACSSDDADEAEDADQTTEEPSATTTGTEGAAEAGSTAEAGGPEWPRFGHDDANTGSNPHETAVTADTVGSLAEVWSLDGVTGVTATPTVVEGVAYFGDWAGNVRAVDPASGDEVWTTAVGGSVIGSPPVTDDAVFAASGVTLYRLDRATGEVEWEAKTNEHPFAMASAAPVVVDDLVVLGVASGELTVPIEDYTFSGSISAYDTETGEEAWRIDTTTADDENGAGVGIWSTPAVDTERGLLFVGTGNTYEEPSAELANSLLAIDYRTGEIAWSTQFTTPDVFSAGNATGSDSDVGASPNLWTSDGRDLVGAGDKAGDFHALDRETGEVVWETTLTPGSVFGGVMAASAFIDGRLIVTSNVGNPENNAPTGAGKAFALDPATGDISWEVELDGAVYAPVSAVPGVAFVGTTTNVMLALDTGTGEELWRHEVTNQVGAAPAIVDGRVLWGFGFSLFQGPGDGGIVAFEPTESAGAVDSTDDSTDDSTGDSDRDEPTNPAGDGEGAAAASAGCGGTETLPPGTTDRTMTSGGIERRYQLIVPEGYDGTAPLPVVLGLHALTVPYGIVPGMSGFADMAADGYEFIGVAPSGLLDGTTAYWLAADVPDNRDVQYIADLLDELGDLLCIDTNQVFSTGMSNGGQMSSLLACRLADRVTAVAPVSGVEWNEGCDGDPVPVMAFHGDADPIVTYDGGGLNANRIADLQFYKGDLPDDLPTNPGVFETLELWAEHNGCEADPVEEQVTDEVVRYEWDGCDAPTTLYVVQGAGHSWPGRPVPEFEAQFGPGTTDIDATALMFELFLGPPES